MSNEHPVAEQNTAPKTATRPSQKPVIIYIMILFIAAFLLMALSFAMNQRSHREAIGKLETSFNATVEEIQSTQEKILSLEKELDAAKDQLANTESLLQDTSDELDMIQKERDAMQALYLLQQKYSAGLYQECITIAEEMDASGLVSALSPIPVSSETGGVVTAPYSRYQQLKEASLEKLAYNTEE